MKVGSLFSGVGGFDYGLERAGMRVVWQSEIEPYCCEVLKKHWPEVPNLGDIFSIKDPPAVDLICGGFPCQPFSVAGKRQGKADNRYLWPQMLRVITEVKPRWVFAENVPGILHMELDQVLSDLEGEGYETGTLIIPACALNAPHRRSRVWIVAFNAENPLVGRDRGGDNGDTTRVRRTLQAQGSDRHAPDTDSDRTGERSRSNPIRENEGALQEGRDSQNQKDQGGDLNDNLGDVADSILNARTSGRRPERMGRFGESLSWELRWPEVATRLCRVDDGLPAWVHRHRVKRLKALGNAIVPQIAEEIGRMILEIDSKHK